MTVEPVSKKTLPLKRRFKQRRLVLSLLALALLLGVLCAAYFFWGKGAPDGSGSAPSKGNRSSGQNRNQPVSVAEVSVKDVRLWLPAIGTAIPRNLVTLHARVDGELLRLYFTEGDTVKQGQLLAELDPRSYQAQLTQVNGQLTRDSALLQNARIDLERYRELWAKDSIARQQVDTQESLVRQYEGTVENDRGLVENAKLQLSYTRITAPVSGRVGLRQVDPGNQIHASDANGLVSIAQIEPITVVFAVPESQLPEINRRRSTGDALLTEAWDREQKTRLANGRLLTTDNQIDSTTGTIKLKAEFTNTDRALFPNQFVNVRLLLGIKKDETVIPSAAIMRGAKGSFVYTVDSEGSVKSVPVTLGAVDGEWMAMGEQLKPGERVVTDGADKLRDGAKVDVIVPEKNQAADEKPKNAERGKRPEGGWRGQNKDSRKGGDSPDRGQRQSAS